jgi:membrane protein YqaA with SNARE-associated domain
MDSIIKLLINYGPIGIMISAFSEGIFLPVPMELISIPIALSNPSRAFFYSLLIILFSSFGSITGYYIGKNLGKPLLIRFVSDEYIGKLEKLYSRNSFLTVLTSTFTPIPYEAYVLSAGIFNIGVKKFILAAIISRVLRHLPQGILISLYGTTILSHFKNYSSIVGIIIFCLIILLKHLFSIMKKPRHL